MTNKIKFLLVKNIISDKNRKSILLISKDLMVLKKTHSYRELRYYFRSLMYKKDAGNIHMYVNDTILLKILKFNSQQGNWQLLANKVDFIQKMAKIPGSIPVYLGKIEKGYMYDTQGNSTAIKDKSDIVPIIDNLIKTHKTIFIKKNVSFGGKGVFRFNDTSAPLDIDKINIHEDYLIEKGLIQHDDLNKINPHCVNTVRVMSLNRNGIVKIPSCHLKMGVDNRHNDNVATGGIFVNYDIEKNKLSEIAIRYINLLETRYYSHPNTHFVFKDQQLPYPDRVISLVTKAAELFPDRFVIGWDVAYTPEGPVIIEGNTNPCPVEIQLALRGMRNNKIYDELYHEFNN